MMIEFVETPYYLVIKRGRFKKEKIPVTIQYEVTFTPPAHLDQQADGYNDHYFDKDARLLYGSVFAVLGNFDASHQYQGGGTFDLESCVCQLMFTFLCERICMELSLLEDFGAENKEITCNPCICQDTAMDILDLERTDGDEEHGT